MRDLAQALDDPQTAANDMIWEEGSVRIVANPMHLSATPASLRRLPPRLGQQSEEILLELDLSREEIAELQAEGVVG